eukprot:Gb_00406 [translate_table: standard]
MGAPITMSLIAIMVVSYLRLSHLAGNSCTAVKTIDPKQWFLLIFNYAGKGHLAYDMVSLLWKGMLLEGSIGSRQFGFMVVKLLLTCDALVIMTGGLWGATDLYASICEVRLTGLLFALNFVLNNNHNMYGLVLPMNYWSLYRAIIETNFAVEFALVCCLFPGIPFSGPVCGTLAGLLYSYAPQLVSICKNIFLNETELVWMCQSCRHRNGVFFLHCENCDIARPSN